MAGFPQAQIDATQLVSNRHTVLEDFQSLVMSTAFIKHNHEHQTIKALHAPETIREYKHADIIHVFAKESYDKSVHINDVIDQTMPDNFVSDVTVEYSDLGVESQLVDIVKKESGDEGFQSLLDTISDLLSDFSSNGASYVQGIMAKDKPALGQVE